MTQDEFRAALDQLGFSQVSFGVFLKMDPRSVRRWAAGDSEIPPSVIYLLKVMLAFGLKADWFESK